MFNNFTYCKFSGDSVQYKHIKFLPSLSHVTVTVCLYRTEFPLSGFVNRNLVQKALYIAHVIRDFNYHILYRV